MGRTFLQKNTLSQSLPATEISRSFQRLQCMESLFAAYRSPLDGYPPQSEKVLSPRRRFSFKMPPVRCPRFEAVWDSVYGLVRPHLLTVPTFMFLRKMQGIIYCPLSDSYPRKREELFFLVQAVIPSCAGWNGQASSFTVLLDAPAWNSCLLDGIHGKYIIKRYEKRLHCIGPSCNTEQYLFRYGLLCRDPEYGIEGSEMHWHQGQWTGW